jgi:hypothetical protein
MLATGERYDPEAMDRPTPSPRTSHTRRMRELDAQSPEIARLTDVQSQQTLDSYARSSRRLLLASNPGGRSDSAAGCNVPGNAVRNHQDEDHPIPFRVCQK